MEMNKPFFTVFLLLFFISFAMSTPLKAVLSKEMQTKTYQELKTRHFKSEVEINEEKGVDLFEGDIVLTDDDKKMVDLRSSGDADGPIATSKRKAIRDRNKLWKSRIIPYVLDSSLSASALSAIRLAISDFDRFTCIRWKPRKGSEYYVKFVKDKGCFSNVGRVNHIRGYQKISIDTRCDTVGTVMHEMMHTIGFWHEHSRPDRNQVVEVMWENIKTGKENNFNKRSHFTLDVLGLPYDLNSLMHYTKYAFSNNGKRTLQKIGDPNYNLGQRFGFSKNDKLHIKKLYSCTTSSGGWSEWSTYTPCDSSCKKTKTRFCTNTNPAACNSKFTKGVEKKTAVCPYKECYAPVDGHWGRWSSWSACSKTCDLGTRRRSRLCNDPVPKYGGAACVGDSTQSKNCRIVGCKLGPDDCEFDNPSKPFCDWTQDPSDTNFYYPDWLRKRGSTQTSHTGPTADHTTGTGFYIYGESSSCQSGRYVRLLSKKFPKTSGPRCMGFWYHMYGATMGSFNIYIKSISTGVLKKIFTKSGNQGTAWIKGNASIKSSGSYKIVLEMVCGSSFRSDVAVDDIIFKNRACPVK